MIRRYLWVMAVLVILAGCSSFPSGLSLQMKQIWGRVADSFSRSNVVLGDPVFIRIFKEEHILELWMKNEDDIRFKLVKTYSICNYSGQLGPKVREGDMQSPEGFYHTALQNLNPNSDYHLSFNVNYPNDYDRSLKRSGSYIMVHGDCVSKGCYAMTDRGIEEIYMIIERALQSGQYQVPVHIFPFRMTPDRMIQAAGSPHYPFWANLKAGYDYFERYGIPPKWRVSNGQYEFY